MNRNQGLLFRRGMFALTAPVGDIFRAKIEEAYQKRRREMARVIRTWRTSRAIRLLVLTAVLATTTNVIVSWSAGAVQSGAVRQTTVIGGERLVSVEPLTEQNGELCVPEPVGVDRQLIASLLPQQSDRLEWERLQLLPGRAKLYGRRWRKENPPAKSEIPETPSPAWSWILPATKWSSQRRIISA